MKPHRTNRSRSYYQHHQKRVIQCKMKIAKMLDWHVPYAWRFAKGKVHCSCWMCSRKTNRDGFPYSQIIQLVRLNCQLSNYFSEDAI